MILWGDKDEQNMKQQNQNCLNGSRKEVPVKWTWSEKREDQLRKRAKERRVEGPRVKGKPGKGR